VRVSFYLDDRLLRTVRLQDHQWHEQSIPVPKELVGKEAVLKVTVDRTWRSPGDSRELGVAYRE